MHNNDLDLWHSALCQCWNVGLKNNLGVKWSQNWIKNLRPGPVQYARIILGSTIQPISILSATKPIPGNTRLDSHLTEPDISMDTCVLLPLPDSVNHSCSILTDNGQSFHTWQQTSCSINSCFLGLVMTMKEKDKFDKQSFCQKYVFGHDTWCT